MQKIMVQKCWVTKLCVCGRGKAGLQMKNSNEMPVYDMMQDIGRYMHE